VPTQDKDISKSLARGQTRYAHHVAGIHQQMGIPENYARTHKLMLQQECKRPVCIGHDLFDREQFLLPQAAQAWQEMQSSAKTAGIDLRVVSAFRSVEYQAGIINRKLDAGQSIDEILKVSAAPGYSEHHTGRALDISTPGYKPLEQEFENSSAFDWLQNSASGFGFSMSYPKNNIHDIAYEPWHWCFSDTML